MLFNNKLRIQVILKGGLGNQLFQLLHAFRIKHELPADIDLNIGWFDWVSQHGKSINPRSLELDHLGISKYLQMGIKSDFGNSEIISEGLVRMSRGKLSRILGFYDEKDSESIANGLLRRKIQVSGYWIRYEENYLSDLFVNEMKILKMISKYQNAVEYQKILREIKEQEVLAIHVRLGDYLKYPNIYGTNQREYFARALDRLEFGLANKKKSSRHMKMWIFTDEVEKVESFLPEKLKIDRILGSNSGLCSCQTMYLMSEARAIICSNSTFSWWAGMLAARTSTIIFPSDYLVGSKSRSRGLVRSNWISI